MIKIFKRILSLLDVKDDSFTGKNGFVFKVNEPLNQVELLPESGGGSGSIIEVSQVGIGLLVSLNQPISLVGNSYVLANATNETKVAIGMVIEIIDDDNIKYQKGGEYSYFGGGLIKGDAYYLDTSNGSVTNTEPSNYKQALFEAIEVDKVVINIEPMFVIEPSDGEGSGTTIIKVNQIGIGLLVAVEQPISLVGNSYELANATDSSKVAIGIVTKVVDDDNIEYQDGGEYETITSYVKGTAYYLDTSDGAVIDTEPANYKQVLFTAIETNKILIDVGNMYVLDSDGSTGSAEIIIAVSQVGLGVLVSLDQSIALVGSSYVLANATDETKVSIGIVTKIVDDDNIEYKDTGTYETEGTYVKGSSYYSGIVDGEATDTEPDNFKQSIFRAIETNKILINIENMFVLSDDGNPYMTEVLSDNTLSGDGSSIVLSVENSPLFDGEDIDVFMSAPNELLIQNSDLSSTINVRQRNYVFLTSSGTMTIDVSPFINPLGNANPDGIIILIKDGGGNMLTNNLIIQDLQGKLFDGALTYTISTNYGWVLLSHTNIVPTQWFIIGKG